jgi:hypothetical protein
MTSTLIVTAYNRQESLIRCLESVKTCNLTDVHVFVSHDSRGPKLDTLDFRCIEQQGCIKSGDNIYRALQLAQNSELVMFIEDDYVVEPEFVDWHREIHKQFSPFISCADVAYVKPSNDPRDIMLSHSRCHVRAGCMSGSSVRKLLNESPWLNHFEEVVQKYLIKNKLLAVQAVMPRAHDTGAAGVNMSARVSEFSFKNPITPDIFNVAADFRGRWKQDYEAQVVWGL